jgi:outer membrane protein assembly factor BamB
MFGNGRVFISHTHEDIPRCQPLLAALDAWQIDYWFDTEELDAGQRFTDRIQEALGERDIFLRIATSSAERSFWVDRELRAARGLRRATPGHPRQIIQLCLDGEVGQLPLSPGEGEVVIPTAGRPRIAWLEELRQALGYVPQQRVSRRAALAIGATSVAAVAATALAARAYLTSPVITNPFKPEALLKPAGPSGALPVRWLYTIDFSPPDETDPDGTIDHQVGLAADVTAVYACSPTSQDLLALGVQDGKLLWIFPNRSGASPDIIEGFTLNAATDHLLLLCQLGQPGNFGNPFYLVAVGKATGNLVWKSPDLGKHDDSTASDLCVTDAGIFFQLDGQLYGYTNGGSPLWPPVTTGAFNNLQVNTSTPTYDGGLLFVGTSDGRLLAVNAATGLVAWSIAITGGMFAPLQSSPAVTGGFVYIGASDGYCYAFNAATGALAWKSLLIDVSKLNAPPSFPNYFALMGPPAVVDGVLYIQSGTVNYGVGTNNGLLLALEASSGKILNEVDPTKLGLPVPIKNVTSVPGLRPWYPSGDLIYTTLGFPSYNVIGAAELASVEALLAFNRQDFSLHSFYLASVDGQNLVNPGYFPSAPVPVPGGIAFMSNEPAVYVLDLP